MFAVHPTIPLFVAALINVTRIRKELPFPIVVIADGGLALFLSFLLPKPSIGPWWGPLCAIASQWTRIWNNAPHPLVHGGPLGRGCSKLIQVLVAIVLWRYFHQEWPDIQLGPLPGVGALTGVAILSVTVNIVLQVWSKFAKTRGDHAGVNDMVESTHGRALSLEEHFQILFLAMVNGTCEEITSRWFWMAEFGIYLTPTAANLAQAAVFGIWHYHGIPSGLTGVALTFVYGFIMGLLFQYGQGLFLPIIAHGIADYFIFAVIARQERKKTHDK
mmetsp:Transcript_5427/g.7100  ORF Transcript_5427/g.7100 Transcript_5427/m.7100 type:complete len:274 (+) Transcript_5427:51-872(+)